MELKELKAVIEAILFASGEPVPIERIAQSLEQDSERVEEAAKTLADEYRFERRGICIVKLEDKLQMCSSPEYAEQVTKTLEKRKPPKLSQTALEVLSIVAYFQPVTRAYIEQVRGVDSSYTINVLLQRGLIEPAGRLNVPGRPMLYSTGDTFLRSFGLESLEQLPPLPDEAVDENIQKIQAAVDSYSSGEEE